MSLSALPPEATVAPNARLTVDLDLARKYDRPVPRYTSYPTALQFQDYGEAGPMLRHLEEGNGDGRAPLSLYVHLPFCESLCWFCGCTTVITTNHGMAAKYLDYLGREIDLLGQRVHRDRRVGQLHFGGGT